MYRNIIVVTKIRVLTLSYHKDLKNLNKIMFGGREEESDRLPLVERAMSCVRELDDGEELDLNRMLMVDPMLQWERMPRLILLEERNDVEGKGAR